MQRKDKSPQQIRCKVMRMAKPSSDKMLHAPRPPPPKNGSRPHWIVIRCLMQTSFSDEQCNTMIQTV